MHIIKILLKPICFIWFLHFKKEGNKKLIFVLSSLHSQLHCKFMMYGMQSYNRSLFVYLVTQAWAGLRIMHSEYTLITSFLSLGILCKITRYSLDPHNKTYFRKCLHTAIHRPKYGDPMLCNLNWDTELCLAFRPGAG